MTAARILALGGTLASLLTAIGGFVGSVMLAANVLVLCGVGRERRLVGIAAAIAQMSGASKRDRLLCTGRTSYHVADLLGPRQEGDA